MSIKNEIKECFDENERYHVPVVQKTESMEYVEVKDVFLQKEIKVKPELIENNENSNEYRKTVDDNKDNLEIGEFKVHIGESQNSKDEIEVKSEDPSDYVKRYKCLHCRYETDFKRFLKSHLLTHDNIRPHECNVCNKKFKLKHHLEDHIFTHSEEIFFCMHCGYKSNNKVSLAIHLRREHCIGKDRKYRCLQCQYQTTYKRDYNNHFKQHSTNKDLQFKCALCDHKTDVKSILYIHMKDEHGYVIDKVEEPSIKVQARQQLMEGYKRFKCSQCSYQTDDQADLKCHMGDTDKAVYDCPNCEYKTNYKCKMKQHLTVHNMNTKDIIEVSYLSGERIYKCHLCERKSKKKWNIERHIYNKHEITNARKLKCMHCEYQTNYMNALKRHTSIHDDVKPYECEFCNKRFKRNDHLKRHRFIHSEEKRIQYIDCNYIETYKQECYVIDYN